MNGILVEPRYMSYIKMFNLCKTFGWTLDDLRIPQEEQKEIIDSFLFIIRKQEQDNEREVNLARLRGR